MLTRDEAIKLQYELFNGAESTLIETAMNLKNSLDGSADPWDMKTTEQCLDIIRARLDNWTPSSKAWLSADENAYERIDRAARKYLNELYMFCVAKYSEKKKHEEQIINANSPSNQV